MQIRNPLVLFNPINGKYINEFDEFVGEDERPRLFDSILNADNYSAWFEQTYGVRLYVKQYSFTGK